MKSRGTWDKQEEIKEKSERLNYEAKLKREVNSLYFASISKSTKKHPLNKAIKPGNKERMWNLFSHVVPHIIYKIDRYFPFFSRVATYPKLKKTLL